MSRAGEKLYGNWNGPEGDALERAGRRAFWIAMLMVVVLIAIGASALFGFS